MKATAILGTRGDIPCSAFMDTTKAMQSVGLNCGTLMFQFAMENLIDERKLLAGKEISWNPVTVPVPVSFHKACHQLNIEHRLIKPRCPQTNGMVERFNGRISEIIKGRRFNSRSDL